MTWTLRGTGLRPGSATAVLLALSVAVPAAVAAALTRRVLAAECEALGLRPPPGSAGSLVVFGAETTRMGPSPELVSRLELARSLWCDGVAALIIVSGGPDGEFDEVDDMRDYLVGHGVPPEAVVEGRPGHNTRATILTMQRLAGQFDAQPFVAVTTAFHARRVRDEAHRARIEVVVAAPTSSPELRDPRLRRIRVATEVVATVHHALPDPVGRVLRAALGRWRYTLPLRLAGRRLVDGHQIPEWAA